MTMALATIDPMRCLDCDAPMGYEYRWEDALIRAGGYGATRHTFITSCPACDYWHRRIVVEVAPSG